MQQTLSPATDSMQRHSLVCLLGFALQSSTIGASATLTRTTPTSSLLASCLLPTRHGPLTLDLHTVAGTNVSVLVGRQPSPLVRVHDGCVTSEVFGSLRCDCAQQLDMAMARVAQDGGLILHLAHNEGRGIGLVDKARAYDAQDRLGLDTYAANRFLGHEEDARTYSVLPAILGHYNRTSGIMLLTDSRIKLARLRAVGMGIVGTEPLAAPPTLHSRAYLTAKHAAQGLARARQSGRRAHGRSAVQRKENSP